MAHPTGNNSPGNVLGHNDNANANTLLQPDLLDWLTLTGYHDVQYRTNSLSEYRQAKLQEEAVGFTPSTPHVANPATPQQDRTDHLPTGSHDASGNHAGLTDDFGPPVVGRRRSLSPQPRGPPNRHDFRSRDRFKRSDSEDRGRPRTPRGPPTGPGCARPRASGRPHSFSREKMDDSRDPRLELATLRPPRPMDLGPKGKVRFFVMRSYSWDHVYSSQADGLWATQPEKVGTLQKAFNEEDMTVVLFFAMNRSHSIQGYVSTFVL
ncbi:uncharacterized protein F4822DRAFT_276144 [Hypoxylon trugodes]|uniref:uncharacterized protein n=1 Tax=Hypoxylon trugodes TaxID=326681 RepID=UPI0021923CA6|nr:uncharacterized protein F4822DRAFT_276144 [Hypoxylon trugodes]KAI1387183.1 hypothetical protein F4822DRAFT_276144 [Hypoxylon trugodes]